MIVCGRRPESFGSKKLINYDKFMKLYSLLIPGLIIALLALPTPVPPEEQGELETEAIVEDEILQIEGVTTTQITSEPEVAEQEIVQATGGSAKAEDFRIRLLKFFDKVFSFFEKILGFR